MTSQKSLIVCSFAVISIFLIAGTPMLSMGADKHTQVGYGVDTNSTVDITIVTKTDQPVSNAIVQLKSPGAFETTYRTDEDGYFTAMIPCRTKDDKPITHEVVVTHDNYKTATGTFTTGEDSCDKTPEITLALETK
jgi:hypothetical protein